MFRVKKAQFEVFSALSRQRYEVELAAYLRQELPEQTGSLGDSDLGALVSHAITRGKKYGFITEHQVAELASLMVLLGRDFDEDRSLPWAKKILNDPSFLYPGQRLEALWEEVEEMEPVDEDSDAEEEVEP